MDFEEWKIIDEKYVNGIVKEEHIKLIIEILNRKYDEYSMINSLITRSILIILASDAYSEGRISEEILQSITTIEDVNKHNVVRRIVANNSSNKNAISEETIKLILKEKTELIIEIINHIVLSKIIKPEEKEGYILAMLTLPNKEELCNLCKLYKENEVITSNSDFARNFVLYTLPVSQGSYTRKKQKQNKYL